VTGIGRSSIHWEYEIVRHDGVRAIRGRIVAAAVGPDGQKRVLPPDLRAKLGFAGESA